MPAAILQFLIVMSLQPAPLPWLAAHMAAVLALVFVLIGVMSGGLSVTLSPFAEFANQSQALAQGLPELEWSKTFGNLGDDFGDSVQQTSDGGYVVAGFTESYGGGGEDVWLIKTDSSGNKVWDKTFGGTSDDAGWSVQQLSDEGLPKQPHSRSSGPCQASGHPRRTP